MFCEMTSFLLLLRVDTKVGIFEERREIFSELKIMFKLMFLDVYDFQALITRIAITTLQTGHSSPTTVKKSTEVSTNKELVITR